MFLDGFGISCFRSFGADFVRIPDLHKINVFLGKNNSGKSNILLFCKHLASLVNSSRRGQTPFNESLDCCLHCDNKRILYELQIKKGSSITGEIHDKIMGVVGERVAEWDESFWLPFQIYPLAPIDENNQEVIELGKLLERRIDATTSNTLARQFLTYTGGSHEKRALDLARVIFNFTNNFSFRVRTIEAHRQIADPDQKYTQRGQMLIDNLQKLQSPNIDAYEVSKTKFMTINNFLRDLLDTPDAFLEIPSDKSDIYVSMHGKILPLNSLGTGIHELVTLAAEVTIVEDHVICLEEPELHMHQELQKKFIRYIQNQTNNQYLITSHSNAFFDIDGVNIYHCRLENKTTQIDYVLSDQDRQAILSDLGYKPSDILLSNFIIWVEGPSDRIYLNHWISAKEPELEEGLHYSIMFYGGRLLSHLAYDAYEVSEFIKLSRLNRNAAIVIDSDKKSAYAHLNRTKKRVKKDFEENDLVVWITAGKEIENYIAKDLYKQVIEKSHPRKSSSLSLGRYDVTTKFSDGKAMDKIALAKAIVESKPNFSVYDLDKRINDLVKAIQFANRYEA